MQKIESSQTEEFIAKEVKKLIYSGELKDGDEITQEELADSLKLSRMPIRGAFVRLQSEGVVTRLPNRHIRVNGITKEKAELLAKALVELEKAALSYIDFKAVKPSEKEENLHLNILNALDNATIKASLKIIATSYLGYFMSKFPNKERLELLKRAVNEKENGSVFLDQYLSLLLSDIEGAFSA